MDDPLRLKVFGGDWRDWSYYEVREKARKIREVLWLCFLFEGVSVSM